MMLWLRHVRLLPVVFGAVAAAAVVRLLVFSLIETDGARSTMTPLWVSMALVLPLTLMFTTENAWERVSVRPVIRRRAILITAAVAVSSVVAFTGFPNNAADYGSLATLRNSVALLGVGLLFLMVVPPWAVWIAPAVLGFLSMSFAAPWFPSVTDTGWAALRMPGTLTSWYGGADISWWVCLSVFAVGAGSYLFRWSLPTIFAGSGEVKQRAGAVSARRQGIRRAMLLAPMTAVPVVAALWTLGAQLPYWGGSPHLLLVENVPFLLAFALPTTFAGGIIAGQYRWRSSVSEWEQLSSRPTVDKVRQVLGPLLGWLLIGIAGSVLAMLAVAAGGAMVDGVGFEVVCRDILDNIWIPVLIVAVVILAGGLGGVIGMMMRGIWVPLAGLVTVTILGIFLVSTMDTTSERAFYPDLSDNNVVCIGEGPEVCAVAYDAGYLDPALTTVNAIYSESVFADDLPRRVYIVDSIMAGVDRPGPLLALSMERGIIAPESLDLQVVRWSLESSITQACVPEGTASGAVRSYLLPGIDQIHMAEPTDEELVRESLHKAVDCFADIPR